MKKRMTIAIVALIIVFGGIFGYVAFRNYMMAQYFASRGAPTITVAAREAQTLYWQPRLTAVGQLSAVNGVDISNQVPGVVTKISFQSGAHVEAGEVLVKLDDSAEQAKLPGLRARVDLLQANLARAKELAEQNLASQEKIDTLQSKLQQAQAQLQALKVRIAKKTIRAPFTGTLGIRQVDLGQYLPAGTDIVTLQALDRLYVNFMLPEQFLNNVHAGQPVEATVPTYPKLVFRGQISAVAVKVDPSSHNFQVQAVIKNPDHKLRPGMFADVNVLAGSKFTVTAIPKTAVSYSLFGDLVYLVKKVGETEEGEPKLVANQTFVELGESRNGMVSVVRGVEPGQLVVTAGGMKLQDGSFIKIDNEVALRGVEPAAAATKQQVTPTQQPGD